MTRDEALKKIKKCLALAKSQEPHEAASATRQAHVKWESALSSAVAEAFGCQRFIEMDMKWLSNRFVKSRKFVFIGVGASAEVAAYAYEVLSRQCAKARLEHVRKQPKNCKPITKTARGDQFALGWAWGVRDMLDKFANSDRNQLLLENYMSVKHPDL